MSWSWVLAIIWMNGIVLYPSRHPLPHWREWSESKICVSFFFCLSFDESRRTDSSSDRPDRKWRPPADRLLPIAPTTTTKTRTTRTGFNEPTAPSFLFLLSNTSSAQSRNQSALAEQRQCSRVRICGGPTRTNPATTQHWSTANAHHSMNSIQVFTSSFYYTHTHTK